MILYKSINKFFSYYGLNKRKTNAPMPRKKKKTKREQSNPTNKLRLFYRNTRGLPSSIPFIEHQTRHPNENYDAYIFAETMTQGKRAPEIKNLNQIKNVPAATSLNSGRPSGGVAGYLNKTTKNHIQEYVDGNEPQNCMVLTIGDGKNSPPIAIILFYRKPHGDKHAENYFEQLKKLTESLQSKGFYIITMGDANAHLNEDEEYTARKGDFPGLCWTEATYDWGTRIIPTNDSKWTYMSTNASDARSIIDFVAVQNEIIGRIKHLQLIDTPQNTDHRGLLLTMHMENQKGKPFKPKRIKTQRRLERNSPTAQEYEQASKATITSWIQNTENNRDSWHVPSYATSAIKRLENNLKQDMDKVNPPKFPPSRQQRKETDSKTRQEIKQQIERMCSTNLTAEQKQTTLNSIAETRITDEKKRINEIGKESSEHAKYGRLKQVWSIKNKLYKTYRHPLPKSIRAEDGVSLLWKHDEVITEVSRAVSEIVNPKNKHYVGKPDMKYSYTCNSKHRELRRIAILNNHDWAWDDSDPETMLQYFKKHTQKKAAVARAASPHNMSHLPTNQ